MTWLMAGITHWKSTGAGVAASAILGILWGALHGTMTATAAGTVVSVTLPADWSTWALGLVPALALALYRPAAPLIPPPSH